MKQKVFTKRLWQFAGCALTATIAMYLAFYFIAINFALRVIILSVLYFCAMYSLGWYFGKKDYVEHNIYDIGIRWHAVTFIVCVGMHYLYTFIFCRFIDTPRVFFALYTNNTIVLWGLILLVHFILFLRTRKNAIKGYNKEEIFE